MDAEKTQHVEVRRVSRSSDSEPAGNHTTRRTSVHPIGCTLPAILGAIVGIVVSVAVSGFLLIALAIGFITNTVLRLLSRNRAN